MHLKISGMLLANFALHGFSPLVRLFGTAARRHVMVRLGDSFTSAVINNQELRNKRSNRKHKIQNTDSVLRPSPS